MWSETRDLLFLYSLAAAARAQYSKRPLSLYAPVVELGPVKRTAPVSVAVPLAFSNRPVPPTAVSMPERDRPLAVGVAIPSLVRLSPDYAEAHSGLATALCQAAV